MHEIVQMAEEIQVFGASDAFRGQVDQLIQRVRRPLLQTRFLTRAVPALYQSMAFLLLVLALAVVYLSGATAIAELGGGRAGPDPLLDLRRSRSRPLRRV